jgi:hypothetical protein
MDGQSTTVDWIAPWFTIWISPRATIRRIVDVDPNRFIIGIAWIAGALAALNVEVGINTGTGPSNFPGSAWLASPGSMGLAIFAFMLGVGGVVMLYLLGMLYRWSGGVLGGTAQALEVRSALAWAQVPAIYITVLGVLAVILGLNARETQSAIRPAFSWWTLVQAVLSTWAFIILLLGITLLSILALAIGRIIV